MRLVRLREDLASGRHPALLMLLDWVLFVLLIPCAVEQFDKPSFPHSLKARFFGLRTAHHFKPASSTAARRNTLRLDAVPAARSSSSPFVLAPCSHLRGHMAATKRNILRERRERASSRFNVSAGGLAAGHLELGSRKSVL